MCIWQFRGSFFPLQFWVCKVHDRSASQPAGRLHPSKPHLPYEHLTFPLSLLSKKAPARAIRLFFLFTLYRINIVFFPPKEKPTAGWFNSTFYPQFFGLIRWWLRSDEMFVPVYCFSVGKFAPIKQIIGLNRVYLFNYFSFADCLQIRGLQLRIIRGFLLQI